MRVTPPSTAAAPTMAYIPGVMQRLVCVHEEKKPVSPTSLCSISMAKPIMRPTKAPTEGKGARKGAGMKSACAERSTCEGGDEHSGGKACAVDDAHEQQLQGGA